MNSFFKWGADIKRDIPSSFVVFLVALPLCLGIGVASGVEPISGLLAGIAGGIVVTVISGSSLGVSGPAAGLVALVLTAMEYFKSIDEENAFSMFLVAVMFAGVVQILMGVLKLGKLVAFFPGAVIRGMLAAIGIIIILKQIPHAFGFDKDYEGDLAFHQPDGENTFTEIVNVFHALFTGSDAVELLPGLIFGLGILITLIWNFKAIKNSKISAIISAPLVIVVSGALLVYFFRDSANALIPEHRVNLGGVEGVDDVFRFSPDFSILSDPRVYLIGATIALVASLESLLCMEATDKMDPEVRHSPPNRELIAQGAGNLISGFIGGLPVTQVIVRSSANLQSNAKSKLSAFAHGWWLLLSVVFLPDIMEFIPLSALAAVLIVVGLKLAKPSIFADYFRRGWKQFIPFLTTVLTIVFSDDLLIGIATGFAVSLIITLINSEIKSIKSFLATVRVGKLTTEKNDKGEVTDIIYLNAPVSFLSKASLRTLASQVKNKEVIIDLMKVDHMDDDGQEALSEVEDRLEREGKHVRKHGGALIK